MLTEDPFDDWNFGPPLASVAHAGRRYSVHEAQDRCWLIVQHLQGSGAFSMGQFSISEIADSDSTVWGGVAPPGCVLVSIRYGDELVATVSVERRGWLTVVHDAAARSTLPSVTVSLLTAQSDVIASEQHAFHVGSTGRPRTWSRGVGWLRSHTNLLGKPPREAAPAGDSRA